MPGLRLLVCPLLAGAGLAFGLQPSAWSQDCVTLDPTRPVITVNDPSGRPVAAVPGVVVNPVVSCLLERRRTRRRCGPRPGVCCC